MNNNTGITLAVTVCSLLLILTSLDAGEDPKAGSTHAGPVDTAAKAPTMTTIVPGSMVQAQTDSSKPCLPYYGEPQFILRVSSPDTDGYEPELQTGDLNRDGLDDVLIRRSRFGMTATFPLEILLNDGNGNLAVGTSGLISGTVPAVQAPALPLIMDLNGDGFADVFVPDFGMDAPPYPGYQNTLLLSTPGGKLVDVTADLPQRDDNSLQACAADVDGDKDLDLYIANGWGLNLLDPYILLNDGNGGFSVGTNLLPPMLSLYQNGYDACEFQDVNNDGAPDLVLGDHGDDLANEHSTPDSEVLVNDGTGVFTRLPGAIPPKPFSTSDLAQDILSADLNDDGYQDLLMAYTRETYVGWYIQVLINNRDGTFRDETDTRLPESDNNDTFYIYHLSWMDIDRDQDMDLIARTWGTDDPNPLLFLNNGNGVFRRQPFDFGLRSLYYTFLDLDGDGGHDLVFATFAPPEDIYAIRDLGCPIFLPLVLRNH